MAYVVYFLDGPEAGTVRRFDDAPGREWRMAQFPAHLQATPRFNQPCPTELVTSVVTYSLFKLPEGWPRDYWRDTEYVAKVSRFGR